MPEEIYSINIECRNCYHVWVEEITRGQKVIDRPDGVKVVADNIAEDSTEYIKEIACPNCGCKTETERSIKRIIESKKTEEEHG
jgi:hypothetical protein